MTRYLGEKKSKKKKKNELQKHVAFPAPIHASQVGGEEVGEPLGAQFPLFSHGDGLPLLVDDFRLQCMLPGLWGGEENKNEWGGMRAREERNLHMRVNGANSGAPLLEGVVRVGLETHRAAQGRYVS